MKTAIRNLLESHPTYTTLALRAPLGVIFVAHGAQKLFGWFGGYGLAGTGQWMDSVGLGPGVLMALLAGSAEFFGGIALILGVLTRLASATLAFTMLVAIFAVHAGNGLFLTNDGYEFGLALLAGVTYLIFSGSGKASVDHVLARHFA